MIFFRKLSDVVFKIEQVLSILLLSVMLVSLVSGVVFRYVLNSPLNWSDEVAIFSLVWTTFIGGSMGIKRQQSAAVTIFMDMLKGRLRRFFVTIGLGIVVIFSVYFVWISFSWISSPSISIQKSGSLQIPMIYPYLSVPIGMLFILIHSIDIFLQSLRTKNGEVK